MRNFRKYRIWENAKLLALKTYELTAKLPRSEEYGLKSQIRRAAVSVASNIAEGSGHPSEKEFIRYLEHSLGSAYEIETQIWIASKLQLLPADESDILLTELNSLQKQITSFIMKLKGH